MRSQITLYEDQYQFYKELKSKRLMIAFVEYMFEDIEPELNGMEKVIRNSLKIRMDNQKKKSFAGTQSHGGGRGQNKSNANSKLDSKNNTTNNTTNNTLTTEGTTEKQQDKVKEEDKKENIKRKGYGEFGKCMLSDDEYQKIIKDYGLSNGECLIKQVDNYCASSGKTYKNYVATIRNFAKKAGIKEKQDSWRNESGIYDLPF